MARKRLPPADRLHPGGGARPRATAPTPTPTPTTDTPIEASPDEHRVFVQSCVTHTAELTPEGSTIHTDKATVAGRPTDRLWLVVVPVDAGEDQIPGQLTCLFDGGIDYFTVLSFGIETPWPEELYKQRLTEKELWLNP